MGLGGPGRLFIRAFNAVTTALVPSPLLGVKVVVRLDET